MLKQFIKYLGVGALSTITQYVVLILLIEFMSVGAVISSVIGYLISSILNYLLNYTFTFNSKENHAIAAVKFMSVAFIGLFFNTLIMYVTIKLIGLHYLSGQLLATLFVLLWNYSVNRYWTFNSG